MASSLHALTKFPNLFKERELIPTDQRTGVSSSITNSICKGLSSDLLITAWACLLRSYTSDESVTFLVGDTTVTVDTNTDTVVARDVRGDHGALSGFETTVEVGDAEEAALRPSSTNEAEVEPCLTLKYSIHSGQLQLNATAVVPKDHLPELALQFLAAVRVQAERQQQILEGLGCSEPRLSIINPNPIRQSGPQLLHELSFHACQPDTLAVDFLSPGRERVRLSYEALKARAQALARSIKSVLAEASPSSSTRLQQIIPVLVPQSADLYVALLAILEAGAAFCPLSADAPEERQAFILQDVKASVVITTNSLVSSIPRSAQVKIIILDNFSDDQVKNPEIESQNAAFNKLSDKDLAYILYTSGSTGQPKGVKLSHRAVTQSLLAHDHVVPAFSRFLQFADPTFDVAIFEIFFTFFRGATLAGCEKRRLLNDIVSVMNELEVDGADVTPTIAGSLIRNRDNVPHLKHLLSVGEMLTSHVVSEFGGSKNRPGILQGMYGPTETAIQCTIARDFPASAKMGIIGKPLQSVSTFIAAPQDSQTPQKAVQILPLGHVGELLIGGYQLADGYLNRREQTETAFLHHENYGPLYRTGDQARMLPDGNLECLGRMQAGQIKLRGHRIELGEIEQIILRTEGCRLAAASVIQNNLIIFCTFDAGKASYQNVLETCKVWLPPYMLPNDVVILEEMPRLASGKIDRKGLQASYQPKEEANLDANDDIAPRTPSERWVADLISSILGAEAKLNTNLFRMGLDSLSAIHIASSLRKENPYSAAGATIVAEDILQNPSCAKIVSFLSTSSALDEEEQQFEFDAFDQKYRSSVCEQYALQAQTVEAILPTTALQNGMISQFLQSRGRFYFNVLCIEFNETYSNLDRLRSAWEDAVREHAMLRTGFVTGDDAQNPFMMISYTPSSFELPLIPLNITTSNDEEELSSLRTKIAVEILANLHKPAWRLAFVPRGNNVQIVFLAHHALFDAESLGIIINGVKAAYSTGNFPSAPDLKPALSSLLAGASDPTGSHEAYWTQLLSGASNSKFPDLAPLHNPNRKTCALRFPCSIKWDVVEPRCRALAITLQAAVQVAWARLLSKYTGESDVTFGLVLSGRDSINTENVAFPCTTTVPYRTSTSEDVGDMLKKAMTFNGSVRRHQHCQLTQIQRWTEKSHATIFDTILVLQRADSRDGSDRSWTDGYADATVEYPLSVEIYTKEIGEISFQAVFWDDVIPEAQAQLLLEQFDFSFRDTLGVISHNTTPQMSHHLLSQISPITPSITSDVSCLHGFVERMAQKAPDKVALEYNLLNDAVSPQAWTYLALDKEGNKTANLILDLGIKPGSIIATCFDKSPDAYFGMLGVLKAGSSFLAIDIGAPSARKKFIIEDSTAALVLTDEKLYEELQSISPVPVLRIDSAARDKFSSSQPSTSRQVAPQDTCYCLYTSGSTGTPKGCLLSHENAVQAMLAFQRLYAGSWDQDSRWLQFASFHFDVSVMEQYWSWSVGICVISTPRDILFEDLPGALHDLKITHIDLTPSLARLITPIDVPSLCKGIFITGGEALTQEVLDVWGPENVIHNGYGPTETTIGNIMYTKVPKNGKPLNIGWQFDNVGTYVFEPGTDNLVPRGAIGELCISGKLVAKGYLNKPELTKKSFVYSERYDERLYHTKDLVRMLHDGSFQFCGRVDEQVKLRGQRLELGEVNNAIKSSSELIQEAKTQLLKASKTQTPQLVAFISVKSDKYIINGSYLLPRNNELVGQVQKACRERLPGYMVPSHFVLLVRMPLTGNNKHDSRKLNEIFEEYLSQHSISATPETSSSPLSTSESQVAKVLAESLGISASSISAASNIFQLGVDSINIFPFSRRLQRTGFDLADPAGIMKSQTVSNIAKYLHSSDGTDKDSLIKIAKQNIIACKQRYRATAAHSLQISLENIDDIAPCTPIQQGIIARSLEGSEATYFNTLLFDLAPDIDISRLKKAWNTIYQSIPALRLRFVPIDDGYIQVLTSDRKLPLVETTVTSNQNEGTNQIKEAWISENDEVVKTPLQILIHENPVNKGYRMVVNVFHALYDAISLNLILNNLLLEYKGTEYDLGPSFFEVLPYGPLQNISDAEQFWVKHLKKTPFTPIPKGRIGSQEDNYAYLHVQSLERLETTRRELSVTHQAIFQTCWSFILQEFIGQPTTIGRVVSGRSFPHTGADRVIGPLFNTIPFYVDTTSVSGTWATAIQKCHALNTESLPYQHTSLRNILKWTRSGRAELFDTLFVFQKSESSSSALSDIWKELDQPPKADYPIAFEVDQQGKSTLKLTIVAQSVAATKEECVKLLKDFEALLAAVLSDPWQKIRSSTENFERTPRRLQGATASPLSTEPPQNNDFVWNDEAKLLQSEIAALANTPTSKVTEFTSIFELGLDSIDCIKLSSRLKRRGLKVSVSMILRNSTISRIMGVLNAHAGKKTVVQPRNRFGDLREKLQQYYSRPNLFHQSDIVDVLPLTPLQESMVAEMFASNFQSYFNHDLLRLRDDLDPAKLIQACQDLVDVSPMLRTSFSEVEDPNIDCVYAQIVRKSDTAKVNKRRIGTGQSLDEVINDINIRVRSAGNDFKPCIFTVVETPSANYLILSMAHSIYDGWSLNLLHSDISRAYLGCLQARPYYDHVLQEILNGSSLEAERFWQGYLSDFESSDFPRLREPKEVESVCLKVRPSTISLEQVQQFAQKQNVTLQTLGVLCWSLVLASYIQKLDVTSGIVLAGRDDEEAQQVLFPTMNTLPVRTVIHGTREEMLKYTQDNLADIRQFQYTPLRRIHGIAANKVGHIFDTLFIYQIQPALNESFDALYESIRSEANVEYPVNVEMEIMRGALYWRSACKESVFAETKVSDLLDRLDKVLSCIVNEPEKQVLDFTNEGVTICGLPSFDLDDNHEANRSVESSIKPLDGEETSERDNVEKSLREVLAAVAKVDISEVSSTATIYNLGLDSISAIKVSALLRKRGLRISVSEMMRATTVQNIVHLIKLTTNEVAKIDNAKNRQVVKDYISHIPAEALIKNAGIDLSNVEDILPISSGQMHILSNWQNNNGAVFFPTFVYAARGNFSIPHLQAAWKELVDCHPILRTTFIASGNSRMPVLQVALKNPSNSFFVEGEEVKTKNFDFREAPVAISAKKYENSVFLDLKIHHVLYDAISLPLLIKDLESLYNKTPLNAAGVSRAKFVEFLAIDACVTAYNQRKDFWTEYLQGISNAEHLSSSHHHQSNTEDIAQRTQRYFPAAIQGVGKMDGLLKASGISIQALFVAVFAQIYSRMILFNDRLQDRPDIVIGIYLANRSRLVDELEALAIPTLNIVPLRIKSVLQRPVVEIAGQIQHDLNQISSPVNSGVTLWEIEQWTGLRIDCFVNFLRLPDTSQAQVDRVAPESVHSASHQITIEEVPQDWGFLSPPAEFQDEEDSPSSPSFEMPNQLRDNAALSAYPANMDVEAGVRDGAIDVGVLGPRKLVPREMAERIASEMVKEFEALMQ